MKLKRILALVLCFAMTLSTMGTVVFAADPENITISSTTYYSDKTIDLNGGTMVAKATIVANKGTVTIKNGTIDATQLTSGLTDTSLFRAVGKLVLENVTINANSSYKIKYLFAGYNTVTVKDSTINAANVEFIAYGDSESGAVNVILDNTKLNMTSGCSRIAGTGGKIAFTVQNNSSIDADGLDDHCFRNTTVYIDNSTVDVNGCKDFVKNENGADITIINGSTLNIANFTNSSGAMILSNDSVVSASKSCNITVNDAKYDGYTLIEDTIINTPANELEGEGTEEKPYLINNLDDLKQFRDNVNSGERYNGKFVKLTAKIDLEDEEWTPIGDREKDQSSFLGTFDGGGYTISNLWISEYTKTGAGFFSKVGLQTENVTGTVKNVTFDNVTIVSKQSYVGVIAQAPSGALIENVKITGKVTIQGYGYVGGVVGHGYATINNCSVNADANSAITANYWGAGAILGFAGDYGAKISNAAVSGVKIHANSGGAASVAGSPYGAALTGTTTVKNVEITSNSDYCMSYVAGGDKINSEIVMENVTATANGEAITPGDVVASVNGTMYFSLADAVNAAAADQTVTLMRDTTLTESIKINDGMNVTIGGTGKTITAGNGVDAFTVYGGKLTLSEGLNVHAATDCAIYLRGGDVITSANLTKAGEKYSVIQGNGEYQGNVTINGGKIENQIPEKVAIYWPQNGKLTINGGEIIGGTGIRFSSGSLEITNGKITANGTKNEYVASNGGSVIDTGDAVMIENIGGTTGYDTISSVSITGGTFVSENAEAVASYTANIEGVEAVTGFISGGTFSSNVSALCAEGFSGLPDLNGNYTAGETPTATVKNLGAMTIPANDYIVYPSGSSDEEMPLNFVMQFIADQDAEDMKTSPYADWYADFVITFTGIEEGSFVADGCYLAGFYGETENWEGLWVKIPVDGMKIENGVRYPVMLGVGLPQTYDYICSGVQAFSCAMHIPDDILSANPNLKVNLELDVVDSSDDEKALEALQSGTNILKTSETTYTSEDFDTSVATVSTYEQLEEALSNTDIAAIKFANDITVPANLNVSRTVAIDGCGYAINYTNAGEEARVITVLDTSKGADLTVKNLDINFKGSWTERGINYNTNGTLTLENVYVNGADGKVNYAVNLPGSSDGATVVINNSNLTAAIPLNIWGTDVTATVTNSALIVVDKTDVESYAAVALNNGADNTNVTVTGGEIYAMNGSVPYRNNGVNSTVTISDTTKVTTEDDSIESIVVAKVAYAGSTQHYSYANLKDAVDKATNDPNATVVLLNDTALTESIKVTGTVTVDLNGKTITGPDVPATSSWYAFIVDGGDLTLKDTSDTQTGEIWAKCYGVETKSGSFTMESGKITATNNKTLGSAIANYGGIVTINGGTLAGADNAVYTAGYFSDAATYINNVEITEGNVCVYDYGEDANFTESVKSASNTYDSIIGYEWKLGDDNMYELVLTSLVDGTSASLDSSLALNFYLKKIDEDINGYLAVIEHTKADGTSITTEISSSDWIKLSDRKHIICYTGIAAKEMSDTVSLKIYDAEGYELGTEFKTSLRDYAIGMLNYIKNNENEMETKADWLPALVDMLNYGAAAQNMFKYNTSDLATKGAEDFYDHASKDYTLSTDGCSLSDGIAGTTLTLEDMIKLNVYFKDAKEGMEATYSYTTHAGTKVEKTVNYDSFISGYGFKGVAIDDIAIADAETLVTVKLYDAEKNDAATAVYSVSAYLKGMIDSNSDEPLYPALAKFAASAKNAFDSDQSN